MFDCRPLGDCPLTFRLRLRIAQFFPPHLGQVCFGFHRGLARGPWGEGARPADLCAKRVANTTPALAMFLPLPKGEGRGEGEGARASDTYEKLVALGFQPSLRGLTPGAAIPRTVEQVRRWIVGAVDNPEWSAKLRRKTQCISHHHRVRQAASCCV